MASSSNDITLNMMSTKCVKPDGPSCVLLLSYSPFYSHQTLYFHGGRKCQRSSNAEEGTTTSGPPVWSSSDWPPGERSAEWTSLSSRRSTSCEPFSPHIWKRINSVRKILSFRHSVKNYSRSRTRLFHCLPNSA